jgi:hypothetical protein
MELLCTSFLPRHVTKTTLEGFFFFCCTGAMPFAGMVGRCAKRVAGCCAALVAKTLGRCAVAGAW